MARFEECQDNFSLPVTLEDEDWGSDFESELCLQEIEDNKINEIREANLFQNPSPNVQERIGENSQTIQIMTGNVTKTGAIPKSGFSYLNNSLIADKNRALQKAGKETRNSALTQRQGSQSTNPSRNAFSKSEKQQEIQAGSNNEAVPKKTPRKLKPEAFSFLNEMSQRKSTENGSDVNKERKTMVPTAFSYAENLNFPPTQNNSNGIFNESLDASVIATPSAPPLENTPNNYEFISDESFSEPILLPAVSTMSNENEKPPLPARPPPVFKYPPETFSASRPTVHESSNNLGLSQPPSQSTPAYPKLAHSQSTPAYPKLGHSHSTPANPKLGYSLSSPHSDLKCANVATQDRIMSSKVKNRRSLPSIPVCPAVPKRPLPPLPICDPENVSRIKSQDSIVKIESPDTENEEKLLEPPIIHRISSQEKNPLPQCEPSVQNTNFKILKAEEQFPSNPRLRLAQILTNQTNVDSAVLISQQKIASAITSRAVGSENSTVSRRQKTEESEFRNEGLSKEPGMYPGRSIESNEDQTNEVESDQTSYLEAKEAVNPRRFTDHETLIQAMNRPALPQKAAPIQRSVSCNSLVQSIKDLSFSVWAKPEKKRNSDGISLSKKNSSTTSLSISPKVKSAARLHITLNPTGESSEVNLHHEKNNAPLLHEKSSLQEYPWFHEVDAKEGQLRLLSVGEDGTFLIRPSSRPTADIKNTLCILYSRKVRNLHIRTTVEGRYVLGSKNNMTFPSMTDLIKHHREIPVEILPQGQTQIKPQLYRILLRETPPKLQKLFVH